MKRKSTIQASQVGSELQIILYGTFTPEVGAQLILVMKKMYQGYGTILVKTSQITRVVRKSQSVFIRLIHLLELPRDNIFYKGKKATTICHNKRQVIPSHKSKRSQKVFDMGRHGRLQFKESIHCEHEFLWEEQPCMSRYLIT
jgi:hypothetical protein